MQHATKHHFRLQLDRWTRELVMRSAFSTNPVVSFFCVVGFFYRLTNAKFASLFSLNRYFYGALLLSNTINVIQVVTGLELELIDYQIRLLGNGNESIFLSRNLPDLFNSYRANRVYDQCRDGTVSIAFHVSVHVFCIREPK